VASASTAPRPSARYRADQSHLRFLVHRDVRWILLAGLLGQRRRVKAAVPARFLLRLVHCRQHPGRDLLIGRTVLLWAVVAARAGPIWRANGLFARDRAALAGVVGDAAGSSLAFLCTRRRKSGRHFGHAEHAHNVFGGAGARGVANRSPARNRDVELYGADRFRLGSSGVALCIGRHRGALARASLRALNPAGFTAIREPA